MYVCEICGRKFRDASTVIEHIRTYHNVPAEDAVKYLHVDLGYDLLDVITEIEAKIRAVLEIKGLKRNVVVFLNGDYLVVEVEGIVNESIESLRNIITTVSEILEVYDVDVSNGVYNVECGEDGERIYKFIYEV